LTDIFILLFRRYKENFPKIIGIADDLKAIGSKHGATASQVALAWLLAQGDDIIPIPGTSRVKVRLRGLAFHPVSSSIAHWCCVAVAVP
jgi:aryl-alcohol dehydrogenase-like predicted oxidoreductase